MRIPAVLFLPDFARCTEYAVASYSRISWNLVEFRWNFVKFKTARLMLKRYFAEIASQLARTLAFITNSQRESKDNRRKSRLHHCRDGFVVHEGRAFEGTVLAGVREAKGWTGEWWEGEGREGRRSEKCAREKRNATRGEVKGEEEEEAKCNFSVRRFFQRQGNHLCSSQRLLNSYHCRLYLLKNVYSISFTGKIFTRSLLLEQFSHHRERWELDDAEIREGGSGGRSGESKFAICIRPHFPMLLLKRSYIMRISKTDFSS